MIHQPTNLLRRPMKKTICPQCQGQGKTMHNTVWDFGWKPCTACKGTGQIEIPIIPQGRRPRRF